jgi:hypothetical protein
MITGIQIENFKGIGKRAVLPLKPVTLLFGANSAGKSTVFHAIQYAQEVFARRNLDADHTRTGGAFIDLGGFRSFLHGRDVANTFRVRFDLDLGSVNLLQEFPVIEHLLAVQRPGQSAPIEIDVSTLGDDLESASVEISVDWSTTRKTIYVSSYTVTLDGQHFARIAASDRYGDANLVRDVNTRHPLFHLPAGVEPEAAQAAGILDALYPQLRSHKEAIYYDDGASLPDDVDLGASNVKAIADANLADFVPGSLREHEWSLETNGDATRKFLDNGAMERSIFSAFGSRQMNGTWQNQTPTLRKF